MSGPEYIGSVGVALILVAFAGNLAGRMDARSTVYLLLNLVGAALACLSSALIGFIPFVVMEGVWFAVALWGLARRVVPASA
jgi:hypothetical protein